jgi:hypothetical protein
MKNRPNSSFFVIHPVYHFKVVDADIEEYEVITTKSDKGKELLATKGNCALDTSLLEKLHPNIPTAELSLRNGFRYTREASKN